LANIRDSLSLADYGHAIVTMRRRSVPSATTLSRAAPGVRRLATVALSVLFVASASPLAASAEAARADLPNQEVGRLASPILLSTETTGARLPWSPSVEQNITVLPGFPLTWTVPSVPTTVADDTPPESAGLEIAAPEIRSIRLKPRPRSGPFSMSLYDRGDSMHQQTRFWCVAAFTQTMMNIIDDGKPNRSAAFQKRLHFEGRRLDRTGDDFWRKMAGPTNWKAGLHGLGLTDWAELLNTNGYGAYEVDRLPSRRNAVRKAAKAIRMTGKPVGLVV
jgi:hypothetical protein